MAKVNQLKLQNQWRAIMRKSEPFAMPTRDNRYPTVRAEELKRDVGVIRQIFQRKVDCKNALVSSLARDIEEAEEQYRVALRRHLVKLDDMVGFQQRRIRNLEREYQEELEALRAEFDKERYPAHTHTHTHIGLIASKLTHANTHTHTHTQGER